MCLPPDVIPSALHRLENGKGIHHATQWTVDQRPFVWAAKAAAQPGEEPRGPAAVWTSWNDAFPPAARLTPYAAGIQVKGGGLDEQVEANSSFRSGSYQQASEISPGPKEFEVVQSKVWEPRPNDLETGPAMRSSFFCSPQQPLSRQSSVLSCTSSLRVLVSTDAQESSQSTRVPVNPVVDACESSWVDKLIEEGRMQNAVSLKRKLNSGGDDAGKASRVASHHQHNKTPRHGTNNRPAIPKNEISPRSKEVSMSESLSDNEDASDDEGKGSPGLTEKRRKRMLSNRASAQRSRQRRQERLDTLEVLVAELRVENASLKRIASNAATAAKKLEEELRTMRDWLGKQEEPAPLSGSNASTESDKSTGTSDQPAVHDNKSGDPWRVAAETDQKLRDHGSPDYGTGACCHFDRQSRENSRPSKMEGEEATGERSKGWNRSISSSNFEFDFNSEPITSAANTYRENSVKIATALPESAAPNGKDLYRSAMMMGVAHEQSFQCLDSFGIAVEQCHQEMDNKNLDSRSVEDIWLESLANCLK